MTGRPSRARVGLILAEPYPTEKLPVIKPAGQSRNLQIPLRFYEVRDHPSETGELVTSQIALDPAVTVAIVIDAWETLGERIGSNISDKLAPALLALRAAGIRIAHLPHDRPIHPLARPLEEETVIPGELMDTDMFADMLRNARVKHLIYLGYFSNQCVLRRSLGMLEMRKRGFETTLVRDASAARETPESLEGEWHHRAAIHFIEINGGTTTTTAELQAAVAAMAAT